MGDFLIQFNPRISDQAVEDWLKNRPYMGDRPVFKARFSWGSVVIQLPPARGYEPFQTPTAMCGCAGRPRVVGVEHEAGGTDGFAKLLHRWHCDGALTGRYQDLTGMFALLVCDESGATVITDRMGFMPVYKASSSSNKTVVVGTASELVARATGREHDLDLVSIAERLVRRTITFPYTTRNGMKEVDPGSIHRFSPNGADVSIKSQSVWVPLEPDSWLSARDARCRLFTGMQQAASDVTRGAKRVAVALSGGLDSRTVLACVKPHQETFAVTYADHENREVEVAREVARAAGVEHRVAYRDAHFYGPLVLTEAALLGLEHVPPSAHSACLFDSGLDHSFDLLVGGNLSDTLLKGFFLPLTFGTLLGQGRDWRDASFPQHAYHPWMLNALQPHVADRMLERFRERLRTVSDLRPSSAAEWVQFYPCGREGDCALPNSRWHPSDELFMHRDIVEVARATSFPLKKLQRLTAPVFRQLAGPLYDVVNANTGLPARAGLVRRSLRRLQRRLLGDGQTADSRGAGMHCPWFSDGAWIEHRVFQKHSATWRDLALRGSARALKQGMLDGVFRRPVHELLSNGSCNDPFLNYGLVQLALCLE